MTRTQTIFTFISLTAWTVLGIVTAGKAVADTTKTYSKSYGPATTDYFLNLTLPQFDTSLGTLREVHLSLSNTYDQMGTVRNIGPSIEHTTESSHGNLVLTDPFHRPLLSNTFATSTTYVLPPGASAPYGPFNGSMSSSIILTAGPIFDEFNGGPGNIDLPFSAVVLKSRDQPNVRFDLKTNVGVTASVFYVYDVPLSTTPEPGSTVLLVGVLASGAYVARRRRQNKDDRL